MSKESSAEIRERCLNPRKKIDWQFRNVKISYDDTWREIFREVGNEMGMPREHVERINTAWWRYVSEMMANPALPCIKMLYLGTIKPSVKTLRRYCEKMGKILQRLYNGDLQMGGRTVGDVRKMDDHLLALTNTYSRLRNEADARAEKVRNRNEAARLRGEQKDQ